MLTKLKNGWNLAQIVDYYNNTPHRTIGMSPNQVTEENSVAVYKKTFKNINLNTIQRLKVVIE